jgi:hypothetical protein
MPRSRSKKRLIFVASPSNPSSLVVSPHGMRGSSFNTHSRADVNSSSMSGKFSDFIIGNSGFTLGLNGEDSSNKRLMTSGSILLNDEKKKILATH